MSYMEECPQYLIFDRIHPSHDSYYKPYGSFSNLKSSFGCENSSRREVLFGWKSDSEENKSQRAITTGET